MNDLKNGLALKFLIVLCAMLSKPMFANANEIEYTFEGTVNVLEFGGPPPESGSSILAEDLLGMHGSNISLVCVIDALLEPTSVGEHPDDAGTFAFYSGGNATLTIEGSVNADRDGVYSAPCSVKIDNATGVGGLAGDVVAITTNWEFDGFSFPDVFQVPFAQLSESIFDNHQLNPFEESDVQKFVSVNIGDSNEAFHLVSGSASGVLKSNDPQSKSDCENDGWEQLGFRNKGQCLRFVNTGEDGRK